MEKKLVCAGCGQTFESVCAHCWRCDSCCTCPNKDKRRIDGFVGIPKDKKSKK